MTVRVRFAPSPTGHLHIGGARTALYNYAFAKAQGGKFILRIEDTDRDRSKKEYEESQIDDLKWLGLDYDEGPEKPGEYGPYRQSERLDIYKKHADELVAKGQAFHCFCTAEELEKKKVAAQEAGKDPRYDGTCHNLTAEEIEKRKAAGEEAVIRFKVPKKSYSFKDKVRGEVTFPEDMVGDFVIMRANGLPTYNYCCVVDDWLMKISHVIRAEDHLSNTLRQLMVYEALGAEAPQFVHASLLIGKDRQKLSKRHGATSVTQYRDDNYLPEALINYLCLLGWSHPDEKDVFDVDEVVRVFNLDRFTKAAAIYDIEKLSYINGQHLREMSDEALAKTIADYVPAESEFHKQSDEWKLNLITLFKEKLTFFQDINEHINDIFNSTLEKNEKLEEILGWETTPQIVAYLKSAVDEKIAAGEEFVNADTFGEWLNYVKKELKIKGKPLFMGMRGALTGRDHGSDLKLLIPLTPLTVLKQRLYGI